MTTTERDPIERATEDLQTVGISYHTNKLEQARAEYERLKERLERSDFRQRYTPEAQQQELDAIAEPLEAAEAETREAAQAILKRAEKALAIADLDDSLTPAQLDQAAKLRTWITEDCADLQAEALAKQIRAAVAAGDRPRMWLYQRYGARRLAAEQLNLASDNATTRGPARLAIETLQPALAQLDGLLVSERTVKLRQLAEEKRREMQQVLRGATNPRAMERAIAAKRLQLGL